jgi:hypothetical protein
VEPWRVTAQTVEAVTLSEPGLKNVEWTLKRSASDVQVEQTADRVQVGLTVETETSADACRFVESLLGDSDLRAPVGGGTWLVIGLAPDHG